MTSNPRLLILGAGPTGLGAAYRLRQLGFDNYRICERNDYLGGLSASFRDDNGFTWDVGGHVVFSHYAAFDQFFQEMTAERFFSHVRKSYIRVAGSFVPVYFQNNIHRLPPELRDECLRGLEEVAGKPADRSNFLAWCKSVFGAGITRIFMEPDNEKRWTYPLDRVSTVWIADRVSPVDLGRVRENIRLEQDDVSWGPNSRFDFPEKGGTGAIFEAMRPKIADHLSLNREAVAIDPCGKVVTFSDGTTEPYDALLSTMPLDQLVAMTSGAPESLVAKAANLQHNNGLIVGIGFRQKCPSDKCWIYSPEAAAPFYRVTYFSNYSHFNAPDEDHHSLMCDICYSEFHPVAKETIVEECIKGLVDIGMISPEDREAVVSTYVIDAPYSYPIPSLERDEIVADLHAWLEPLGIHSRGRFGTWLYEIGNMDHSVVMGMQWVDRVLKGERESVWLDRK